MDPVAATFTVHHVRPTEVAVEGQDPVVARPVLMVSELASSSTTMSLSAPLLMMFAAGAAEDDVGAAPAADDVVAALGEDDLICSVPDEHGPAVVAKDHIGEVPIGVVTPGT